MIKIPQAVLREIQVTGKPGATEIPSFNWIEVLPVKNPEVVQQLTPTLGDGESEAIVLAEELGLHLLLDDLKARQIAKERGISLVSTISLLLDAKKARMVELVEPHLNELKTVGFWISDNLFDRVLRMAGEHPQS